MSIKRNAVASYASQIYMTLIGIVMLPLYVKYMGTEAFGLIAFYTMLQGWLQLLDLGFAPTLSRETARFRGGAIDALSLRRLVRALEGIFLGVAVLAAVALAVSSGPIVDHWLKAQQLPGEEVRGAVKLMAVILGLRWLCGLYRSAINGFERLVWLGGFNIAVATARFVLVIPFFVYVGTSPRQFFAFQVVVALVEATVLIAQTYRLLPKIKAGLRIAWDWRPLRGLLKFSLAIGLTSFVGVLVTQVDKLLLSYLLSLTDYGYFNIAIVAASGVMLVSTPIAAALLPRLTKLSAERNETALTHLYRVATQLAGVIAVPAALVLALFSEQVLWVWLGNATIAHVVAPILTLFAIGNGIYAYAAFPYYLQFAKGDLKLHVISSSVFLVIYVPLLLWLVKDYGMKGAGYAWIVANLVPFAAWSPVVHRRFVKDLHVRWLMLDIAPVALLTIAAAALTARVLEWPQDRGEVAVRIVVVSLLLLAVSASGSSWVRASVKRWLMRYAFRKEKLPS
jgi:O-antigen/teichoic acid export membrane protein